MDENYIDLIANESPEDETSPQLNKFHIAGFILFFINIFLAFIYSLIKDDIFIFFMLALGSIIIFALFVGVGNNSQKIKEQEQKIAELYDNIDRLPKSEQ